MGKSVNKVILLGNVGQPPQMKEVGQAKTLRALVTLATNERQKSNGSWIDSTEWHTLVFFGRTAEIVREYVTKGSKILVEGKLHTWSYFDDQNTKRYRTDVIVNELVLLSGTKQQPESGASQPAGEPDNTDIPDDIPF
jgi:single-strand DNA-binding protein